LIKDIGSADGIPFMNVTDEGEQQSLKTGSTSKRRLPIHSSLLELGFLEYVESVKAAGHSRLFPTLEHGANGFGDAVGKYFSRLVTSVGLTDPGLVLHSLRHGGITKLHGAGVQTNQVEMLAGHASNTVNGSVYTHRENIPLSLLREGLERLTYPDVVKALALRRKWLGSPLPIFLGHLSDKPDSTIDRSI
jgi:integrase